MLRFFGPSLAQTGLVAPKLTAPFSRVVDRVVTDPWLRSFIDLECFVLRWGLPARPRQQQCPSVRGCRGSRCCTSRMRGPPCARL